MQYLTQEQLDELKQFDTPTICNGLEAFNLCRRTEGFASPLIKSIFMTEKPVVGYACTAKISSAFPALSHHEDTLFEYYRSVHDCPIDPVSVIQDIDESPIGSFWGEVQATIHRSLGCGAVVTNGGVRDLAEVKKIGFEYFASCILVSHAYVHVEQVNCPVQIGGLAIKPGDLLHADQHGVALIPNEIAGKLAEACRAMQDAEKPMLEGCNSVKGRKVTIEELHMWRQQMLNLRKKN